MGGLPENQWKRGKRRGEGGGEEVWWGRRRGEIDGAKTKRNVILEGIQVMGVCIGLLLNRPPIQRTRASNVTLLGYHGRLATVANAERWHRCHGNWQVFKTSSFARAIKYDAWGLRCEMKSASFWSSGSGQGLACKIWLANELILMCLGICARLTECCISAWTLTMLLHLWFRSMRYNIRVHGSFSQSEIPGEAHFCQTLRGSFLFITLKGRRHPNRQRRLGKTILSYRFLI